MPSGLTALFDHIALIAKLAAASVDDIGPVATRAGAKAAGVVIDDTAVTPRYVTDFPPDRELPVIFRIARGSMKNKLLYILPVAMVLSAFLPWAITPLLMMGGAYLCFEGVEKITEALGGHETYATTDDVAELSSAEHEEQMVVGAVRTDFILSAEIMAIALAEVVDQNVLMQVVILAIVAVVITIGVYGTVGFIVKMDDIGLHLARRSSRVVATCGRLLVQAMPKLLSAVSTIGIAAMIWVGGGIVLHGLHTFHLTRLSEWTEHFSHWAAESARVLPGVAAWLAQASASALLGLMVGAIVFVGHGAVVRVRGRKAPHN